MLLLRPFLLDNLLRVREGGRRGEGGGGELDSHFYHFILNTKLFYQKVTRYQHSWYKMPILETATQEEILPLVLLE